MGIGHLGNKKWVEEKKKSQLPINIIDPVEQPVQPIIQSVKQNSIIIEKHSIEYVTKEVEKIVEVIKEVPVEKTVIVEIPTYITKEVEKIVEIPVEVKIEKIVEVIKEIPNNIIRIETKILEKVPMWAKLAMVLELVVILGLLIK